MTDLLGVPEVAKMRGVAVSTVHTWRARDKREGRHHRLPAPDATVSGRPVWTLETLEAWEWPERKSWGWPRRG